jgi:hypothetical protein
MPNHPGQAGQRFLLRHWPFRTIIQLLNDIATIRGYARTITRYAQESANGAFLADLLASDGRYADPLSLSRFHAQVYSQHGEDGIVAEIFRRIGLPDQPFFLEIGTENGQANNTRFLLAQGWRGVWIDGDQRAIGQAGQVFSQFVATGALKVVAAAVTAENINALCDQVGIPASFDFLSLDIDQNTSHVWRALCRRSRVACIEYNASLPCSLDVEVPYDPLARWDHTNWYGASLKALERIGTEKRLALVGCDLSGDNAFFVSEDEVAGKFREPFNAEAHYETPKYYLTVRLGRPPSPQARQWVVRGTAPWQPASKVDDGKSGARDHEGEAR